MSRKSILEHTSSYHDKLIESLKNPEDANEYLRVAMDEYHGDGDRDAFLLALRNIAEAKGGMGQLAKRTHLNRQNLYSALSEDGNPQLGTLDLILKALGYRLDIQPENSPTFTNKKTGSVNNLV